MDPLSRSLDDIINTRVQAKPAARSNTRPEKREKAARVDAGGAARLGTKKLFIGSFTSECTDDDIRDLFGNLKVKDCELLGKPGRQHLVVTFERFEDAEAAVASINGKTVSFSKYPLRARPFNEEGEKKAVAGGGAISATAAASRGGAAASGRIGSKKLYIGVFTKDVTDEDIRSLFVDHHLRVKEVELLGNSGRQHLVATFERFEDAEAAVSAINGKSVSYSNRPLRARPYEEDRTGGADASAKGAGGGGGGSSESLTVVKKSSASHPANASTVGRVRVSNLPFDITDDELTQIFSECGHIISAIVSVNSAGKGVGTGVVIFNSTAAASKAVKEFDGALINKREITVVVA